MRSTLTAVVFPWLFFAVHPATVDRADAGGVCIGPSEADRVHRVDAHSARIDPAAPQDPDTIEDAGTHAPPTRSTWHRVQIRPLEVQGMQPRVDLRDSQPAIVMPGTRERLERIPQFGALRDYPTRGQ